MGATEYTDGGRSARRGAGRREGRGSADTRSTPDAGRGWSTTAGGCILGAGPDAGLEMRSCPAVAIEYGRLVGGGR